MKLPLMIMKLPLIIEVGRQPALKKFFMSSKKKAFIGITLTLIVLIVLFASTGGYRAARAAEHAQETEETCAASGETNETIAQIETK